MTGWKQPQQPLALSYFLSLGAKYDVVMNLDGFNELALPFLNNLRAGVYPFFPRLWNLSGSSPPTYSATAICNVSADK
jgi:hypothetical protein